MAPAASVPGLADALTTPEVIAAVTAIIAALGGLLTALIRRMQASMEVQLRRIQRGTTEAADQARQAHEGVTNDHGTHLRSDIDDLASTVGRVLAVVEEQSDHISSLSGGMEALAERFACESRLAGERDQMTRREIEGIRQEMRLHEEQEHRERELLHGRITGVKDALAAVSAASAQ